MASSRDIDRLCDEFEAAWRSGKPLGIADFLLKVEEPADRSALLKNLIPPDVGYRAQSGDTPDANNYREFGDEAVAMAAREIAELSQPSDSASSGSAMHDATVIGQHAADADDAREQSHILDGYQKAGSLDKKSATIGPYKLLQQIGQGGMGAVFMAEQEKPVRRRVALKLIKAGMDSREVITRFEAERQALSMMEHQNIARVLDAGTTDDGRPYFVMELVKGIPITDYCDKSRLNLNQRLDLFMQSCRAIQHAHQKGIIHRDIKPSNVLVTEHDGVPVVKVIDFGLAKALQAGIRLSDKTLFTEFGQVVGTLQYMSPEQAELNALDVDTRSDVYSLGILLYELLTGSTPIERKRLTEMALDRVLAAIRDEEAPRPSSRLSSLGASATSVSAQRQTDPRRLSIILKGDLDWIAMKSLEKDRGRRYDSPAQMAEDVQRYLNNEAIIARPPSLRYRLRKTVRKHKLAVGTGITVLSLLIAAIVGTTWGMWNAAKERRIAELAEEQAIIARDAAFKSEKAAIASKDQTEATLARSNYFLAVARWDENRAGDAVESLERVPPKYRQFEWYLARRQFEGGQFTCYGHTDSVTSVSFSPDGRRIVSGSEDGALKLWDADTGGELRTLMRHNAQVNSVCFSPDGRRIVSGSEDGVLKLWDADTGDELRTLKGHTESVTSVCFSPDGRRIVSGSEDHMLKLWDADTGDELRTLKGNTESVTSVCFNPDGRRIVSGSEDGMLKLWDADTGDELRTLKGHTECVTSVCFSPDGGRIVSGSWETTLKLWDADTGDELRTLKGNTECVTSVCFSPDGRRIVSGSEDNTLKLWDAETGEELRTFKGHSTDVNSVCFSPDGKRIVSGSTDGTLKLLDADTGEKLRTLSGHTDSVTSVCFSPDGRRIVSGSTVSTLIGSDNTLKLWDAETGEELRTFKGHSTDVNSVCFSPDGKRIVSGSTDGTLKLLDADTGEKLRTLSGHTDSVTSVCFSPDGRRIVSGSTVSTLIGSDNTLKLWDAETGEELRTFSGHTDSVTSVCFSPDGKRIVSGSTDGTLKLLDADTGEKLRTLSGHTDSVTSVCFSPDGSRIVSGSTVSTLIGSDNTLKLWDAETGEEFRTLKGHATDVNSVCFSPNGRRIVSGSWDRTLKLWDADTGDELRTLKAHTKAVTSVCFSPDGRRIISGSRDGTLKLWDADASAGEECRTLRGHRELVEDVCFSPDGRRIMSSDLNTLKLWDAETGQELRTFKGQTGSFLGAQFGADGRRIESRSSDGRLKLWDAGTGEMRHDVAQFSFRHHIIRSPDDRWLVVPSGSNVSVVDLHYRQSPREKLHRRSVAGPNSGWHQEQLAIAKLQDDWFAAMFHAAWLLKINPPDGSACGELHDAHQKLLAENNGQEPPVAAVVSEMLRLPRGSDPTPLKEESAKPLP